jgi:hypothetical protein
VAHDEKHRSVQMLLESLSEDAPPLCRGTRGNWELGALDGSVPKDQRLQEPALS